MESSLPSFSSPENASRSSILRQQREVALRRRQSLAPPIRDNQFVDGGRPVSRRISLGTINAIADVMAWEEAKTKERIEARINKDDDRPKITELPNKEQMIQKNGSKEDNVKFESVCEREDDVQKQVQMNTEDQRLEKERFRDLERRLAEAERAKNEAEEIVERTLMLQKRNLTECHISTLSQDNGSHDRRSFHRPDLSKSNSGYERYLAAFHQPNKVTNGTISGCSETEAVVSVSIDGINNLLSEPSIHAQTTNVANDLPKNGNYSEQSTLDQEISASCSDKSAPRDNDSITLTSKAPLSKVSPIEKINLDDPNAMRCFLLKPCSEGYGMVQCCIRRNNGLFPEYRMYLNRSNSKTETFLLTSKKRVGNKSSNYLISMSRNDHDKHSDGILGKLRSNFLGTEYQLYDNGRNPEGDDTFCERNKDGEIRVEMAAILYANSTSLGSKGPRKMSVCISKVDADGNTLKVWRPRNKDDERMMTCVKKQTSSWDKLTCLESDPLTWNNDTGSHILYFNGKPTMSSVKNFQLSTQENKHQKIIMQFGKIDKDEFNLEVQWPMSIFQAFAVALSSLDSKLGCD